jgi:hypothetical protein
MPMLPVAALTVLAGLFAATPAVRTPPSADASKNEVSIESQAVFSADAYDNEMG